MCVCKAVSAATLIAMATLSGSSTSLIPCPPAHLHILPHSHHHRHSIPVGSNLPATFSKGNTALATLGKLTLPLPLLPQRRSCCPGYLTRLPAAGGHWDLCAATKLLQFLDEPGACQTKRQLPANHNPFFVSSFSHQPQGKTLACSQTLTFTFTLTIKASTCACVALC